MNRTEPAPGQAQERPSLLFIAGTFPDTQGNGLAMRAGAFVEALAPSYRVTLLVVQAYGGRTPTSDALIERCCEDVLAIEQPTQIRLPNPFDHRPYVLRQLAGCARECAAAIGDRRFDVVHAFRLYMAPIALALAKRSGTGGRPKLHLDLDDVESATRARLARLYDANGRPDDAAAERREAARFAEAEAALLPSFDRVYVASERDAERVQTIVRGELRVAPNVVRLPAAPLQPTTTHPFTLLFVGTLDYLPNQDAARWFCEHILPRIRAGAPERFVVRIVGAGMPEGMAELGREPEVRLVGAVDDIEREYADADAVIVPVRGGGGTRIKVLEAFAYRRPVVSTAIGVEGIEAAGGVHALIGDTPAEFAAQCLWLMREPGLQRSLAEEAYSLVTTRYALERMVEATSGG